jgi:hypothetical protein
MVKVISVRKKRRRMLDKKRTTNAREHNKVRFSHSEYRKNIHNQKFFLEGRCIDLNALHMRFYKQDHKEKENYKEVQNSCSSSDGT